MLSKSGKLKCYETVGEKSKFIFTISIYEANFVVYSIDNVREMKFATQFLIVLLNEGELHYISIQNWKIVKSISFVNLLVFIIKSIKRGLNHFTRIHFVVQ